MRRFSTMTFLLGAVLAAQAASADSVKPRTIDMAQNTATEALPGRDILVAGQDAIADGKSPAVIAIDTGDKAITARTKLELSLAPQAVPPGQPYLVVVSLKPADGPSRRIGTVSFFPRRAGVAQIFYFGAAPIAAEIKARGTSRIDLSITLVPVERTQTLTASVRVISARLVEG